MILRLQLLWALLALGACVPDIKTPVSDCPDIIGVETILTPQKSEIIVIGEVHGMTAPPEFVSALVCHSLAQGVETTLALEMADDDGSLSTFMISDGGEEAQRALYKDDMWTTGFTDGRSSTAMFDLIDTARVIMGKNDSLDVGFFASGTFEVDDDATRSERSSAWEKHMADNIVKMSKASNRTIVLVGNLHARFGKNTFRDNNYTLMAEYLPRDKTRTFNALSAPGTVWNCIFQNKTCESRSSRGHVPADHPILQEERFRVLLADELEGSLGEAFGYNPSHYDGLIYMGAADAAPPANASKREPLDWQ